jgi:hypothetical protein
MPEAMTRRQLLATAGFALLWPAAARAADPRPTLAQLLAHSDCCVAGRSIARQAHWAVLGGARRIVTLHELQVDDVIEGDAIAGQTLIVRTLGGNLDGLTQRVFGEAELAPDRPTMLFLLRVDAAVHVVAGMAAGQFPLRADPRGVMRLHGAPGRPSATASEPSAAVMLEGASLIDARRMLREAQGTRAR